jgi:chromosome segregation ATPase
MNTLPVTRKPSWSHSLPWLEGDERMDPQLGVLDANIGHVQRDVAEIKSDQRRANDKLDAMNGRLDSLRDKIDEVGREANKCIDATADKVAVARTDIATHLESVRKEITAEVNVVRTDLFQKIDTMRGELFVVKESVAAAKVWTLTLQITIAASLLAVMAHGFKWL